MNDARTAQHFQWHPRAHRQWGREQLSYWRLGFFPTYRHDTILEAIEEVLQEHKVLSATCYELIGVYDILLRVWLPDSSGQDEFQVALLQALRALDLKICESFVVTRPVRLWPWDDGKGGLRTPDESVLKVEPPDADLRALQGGNPPEDLVERYKKAELIAPAEHSEGLKFFVVVTASTGQSTLFAMQALERQLAKVLDEAPNYLIERSMYAGIGFGHFLLVGKVPASEFHNIGTEIADAINTDDLQETYGARSYTHLAARPKYKIRTEELPVRDEVPTERALDSLLADEENDRLEVKGSAFLDIDRLVHGDGVFDWKSEKTQHSALKTIVAFLNTRGGHLVIGAVEAKRFGPTSTKLLGNPPQLFGYLCPGVSIDYSEGADWDHYERRLHDVIRERVTPSAMLHLSIQRRQLGGRDFCVIVVEDIGVRPHRDFYYLKEKGGDGNNQAFFVRDGNRSLKLIGQEADDFKSKMREG